MSGEPQVARTAVLAAAGLSSKAGAKTNLADENALIRAAQRGDARAFEALVRLHDQGVLRLAFHLLRS